MNKELINTNVYLSHIAALGIQLVSDKNMSTDSFHLYNAWDFEAKNSNQNTCYRSIYAHMTICINTFDRIVGYCIF